MGECRWEKIADADNCSNYYTKPVTAVTMAHYFSYTHKSLPERAHIAKMRALVVPQDEGGVKGKAHDESLGALPHQKKVKSSPASKL